MSIEEPAGMEMSRRHFLTASSAVMAGAILSNSSIARGAEYLAQGASVERLADIDRTGTAIKISQALFADGECLKVVLVREDNFADAIAATPFASSRQAPILLTNTESLYKDPEKRTINEINRLRMKDYFVPTVLGGEGAISENVVNELLDLGVNRVERLAGTTRFGTATSLGHAMTNADVAFLADGFYFPMGLVAGSAGATVWSQAPERNTNKAPALLTAGDVMPDETAKFLEEEYPHYKKVAIGDAAAAACPSADVKIQGETPGEVSVKVAKRYPAYTAPWSPTPGNSQGGHRIALASYDEGRWPDGLAGGTYPARWLDGNLILTSGKQLDEYAREFFIENRNVIEIVRVMGGTAAISENVVDEVRDIMAA